MAFRIKTKSFDYFACECSCEGTIRTREVYILDIVFPFYSFSKKKLGSQLTNFSANQNQR